VIEFVIVILIFLLIYNTEKSKGAIDNASGVAVLVELTKLLKNNPLDNYDVISLFTGAEEWGLIGSKRYCERNRKFLSEKYDLDRSFNINIDMIGTYIGLIERKRRFEKKQVNGTINAVISEVAQELNIPIVKHGGLINPSTDHKNFKKFAQKTKSKFQVACFHSDYDSKYIHSRRDTPDKCSSETLNNGVNLIFETLKKIDLQLKTK
jgi:Zn-dependent M28 family amino/carboxypeptidase